MNELAVLPGLPVPRPTDDTVRDLLAAGARSDDLHMQRAHRELARAIAHGHEAIRFGAFSSWIRLWRQGVHSAFVVDPGQQETYQRLARAGLRLDHQLAGPDHRTTGPSIAVGDRLAVTKATTLGSTVVERGILLEVTGVEAEVAHLTAPADGLVERVGLREPGWRQLDHGYAEIGMPRHGRAIEHGLTW
jgi:hypothetical protein